MNNNKQGGSLRPIVLLLFAVAVFCVVGIVAEGSRLPETAQDTDKGSADVSANKTGDGQSAIESPLYVFPLTGKTTDKETAEKKPYATVTEASSTVFGISGDGITVEYPTEEGKTRYILMRSATRSLGKIGSIAPCRNGMTSLVKSFGAIMLSSGSDGSASLSAEELDYINLKVSNCAYSDADGKTVTNSYLLSSALEDSGIMTVTENYSLPYLISSDNLFITGTQTATNLQIPYAADNKTEFCYQSSGVYQMFKNQEPVTDGLDGCAVYVTNVLVLFCDAVTYETADTTETVMKTDTSGMGYYAVGGTVTRILWNANSDGTLSFTTQKGEPLSVSRGNTYISVCKSSKRNQVKIY